MPVYTDPVAIFLRKFLSKDGNGLKKQLKRLALLVLVVVVFFAGMAVLPALVRWLRLLVMQGG